MSRRFAVLRGRNELQQLQRRDRGVYFDAGGSRRRRGAQQLCLFGVEAHAGAIPRAHERRMRAAIGVVGPEFLRRQRRRKPPNGLIASVRLSGRERDAPRGRPSTHRAALSSQRGRYGQSSLLHDRAELAAARRYHLREEHDAHHSRLLSLLRSSPSRCVLFQTRTGSPFLRSRRLPCCWLASSTRS